VGYKLLDPRNPTTSIRSSSAKTLAFGLRIRIPVNGMRRAFFAERVVLKRARESQRCHGAAGENLEKSPDRVIFLNSTRGLDHSSAGIGTDERSTHGPPVTHRMDLTST
jgi:hypothetical protein